MRYAKLGNSGLSVSKVCLGAMSFGDANSGTHSWTLSEVDSREIIKNALDAGINFLIPLRCIHREHVKKFLDGH